MIVSRNPIKAFEQGKQYGAQIGTKDGLNFICNILLVCMYNANEDLSTPKFRAFYDRTCSEIESVFKGIKDEHGTEYELSNKDMADILCAHDKTVRARMKMPAVDYEHENICNL